MKQIPDPLLQPEHFIARVERIMANEDGQSERALIQAIEDAVKNCGRERTIEIILREMTRCPRPLT